MNATQVSTAARHGVAVALLCGLIAGPSQAADANAPDIAGYVDGAAFTRLAGDAAETIEVSLQGPLLEALAKFDPELSQLVSGLKSIHAVILNFDSVGDDERPPLAAGELTAKLDRLAATIASTEQRLLGQGWQRVARVKDGTANIQVLVLNNAQSIQGLVVMLIDTDEKQVIFTNVAGIIDLAAIEKMGEKLEIPGLDQLKKKE